MRLTVGTTNCVFCPIRGETSVNTCGSCPLLTRLKKRSGATVVLCRGPNSLGTRATGNGWLDSRALAGRY